MKYKKPALVTLATVVVLAAVIFVASALSQSPEPKPVEQVTYNPAVEAESLAVQAERALTSGETTQAVTLARQALALDANNSRAKAVVKRTSTESDPSGSDDAGDDDTKPDDPAADEAFLKNIKDIGAMLPAEFPGYGMGFIAAVGNNADVSAVPESAGMPAFRIAWAVRDRESEKGAKSYISKTTKELYSKSSEPDVAVDGAVGYFGTNGTDLATLTYVRGRYVFEVVVVADQPGEPEKLRLLAVDAAKAFADEPQ